MKLTERQLTYANYFVNTKGLDKVSAQIVNDLDCIASLNHAEDWLRVAQGQIRTEVQAMPDNAPKESVKQFTEFGENMAKTCWTKIQYIRKYRASVRARLERYTRARIVRQSDTIKKMNKLASLLQACLSDGINVQTILDSAGLGKVDAEVIKQNLESADKALAEETKDELAEEMEIEEIKDEIADITKITEPKKKKSGKKKKSLSDLAKEVA